MSACRGRFGRPLGDNHAYGHSHIFALDTSVPTQSEKEYRWLSAIRLCLSVKKSAG